MRKTWKKIVSVLMALTFVVLGLPVLDTPVKSAKAAAQTPVEYTDENGNPQTVTDYTLLSADDHAIEWANGIYVVGQGKNNNPVTYGNGKKDRVSVSGNVVLIIPAGRSISIPCGINVPADNSLTIYGEGTLTVSAPKNNNAGIGGSEDEDGGSITIVGGKITVKGGKYGAGIGGGNKGKGGTITICGTCEVTATGGTNAAGIGGGAGCAGGTINIQGGTVTATGGENGAGIGSGRVEEFDNSSSSIGTQTITISGGSVTAKGGSKGSGIGSGQDAHVGYETRMNHCGTITITGGTVKATAGQGGNATGIGGYFGSGDIITISGGTVTATVQSGGHTAIGGANDSRTCAVIKITGGNVTASAGNLNSASQKMSTGIGNGYNYPGSDGSVSLDFTDTSSVKAFNYDGKVTLESPAKIDGTETELEAGLVSDRSQIANVTLVKGTTPTYTITWKDDEGNVIDTTTVDKGVVPTHADPTKKSSKQYDFEFTGWNPEVVAATEDTAYTATFNSITRSYTITWKDGDNKGIGTSTVDYGETPAYTGATPTKTQTDKYTFTFNNTWSPAIESVTGDQTYTAQFDETVRKYTITWKNGDGGVITTEDVAYDETPVYSGETPTKTATGQYSYVFNNTWSPTITTVTGPATYTAQFTESTNFYTVSWVVDGTTTTTNVEYGNPAAFGSIPTKAKEGDVTFVFSGWKVTDGETVYGATEQLPNVTGPGVSYTALFTAYYPITFGEIIEGSMIVEGYDPDDPRAAEGALITLTLTPTEGYQYHDGSIKVMCGNTEVENVGNPHDNQFEFTMPAGSVEITAACERFYNIWVNGEEISSLTASNVLHDSGTPRITFKETSEKMILTILTGDDIVLNTDADKLQSGALICVDDERGLPLEIIAEKGLSLVSDSAYTGILSTKSNITMQGDLNIELSYLGESNLAHYGIELLSLDNSEFSIVGDLSISLPIDAQCGTGIFCYGDVDIQGCGVIQGGGDHGITAWGDVSIVGKEIAIGDKFRGAISCAGVVTLECTGDKPISLKGKEIALGAGGSHDAEIDTLITGDLDVAVGTLGSTVIEVSGKLVVNGDVSLTGGQYGSGICAESVEITGSLTGAIDGFDYELVNAGGGIIIGGSVHGDSKNGKLLWANGESGTISIGGDITGIDGGKSVSKRGIMAVKGITIGGDVEMRVLKDEWAEEAYAAIEVISGDITIQGNVNLESEVDGICADNWGSTVTLKKDAYITITGEGCNGISAGQVTMISGVWDITTNDGRAIYAYNDITIPEGYGISTPEDGEVRNISDNSTNALYENYFTITDPVSPDVPAPEVTIEPCVEVIFVNADENKTELAKTKGFVGKAPKYTGEEPTMQETDAKKYTFDGWSYGEATYATDDLPTITEDMTGPVTFTASYDVVTKQYEVTFYDEDGETVLLAAAAYDYGTKADDIKTPEKTPTKRDDAQYTYEFEGWDPELAEVTGSADYKAKYKKVLKEFTVIFVNEDGTELQSGKVAYGETPKYDGATPTKASDDKYDYTFDSWTPAIAEVTGDATYTATFKATEIKKDEPVVKGVYKYVSEGTPKYTKGSKKSVLMIFKRTENDEITFEKFQGLKTAKGELISGTHYTAKKGSVEITLLPEYLETLEVGKTSITVSFEDGDPVTIELEVVAAQQQTDPQNPATGDQMNYIWIFFGIGVAALAILIFVQVQRRREEY